MPHRIPRHVGLSIATIAMAGCAAVARRGEVARPIPAFPFAVDTARARLIRPGVTHQFIYSRTGPWAIHVLDVDLTRCYTAVAVKGASGAVGREKTSVLIRDLARTEPVVGGVNADFFLFTPPGVPTGALVSKGRVIAGPSSKPVFAIDSAGAPRIAVLQSRGVLRAGDRELAFNHWNHLDTTGTAVFDRNWGAATDTASNAVKLVVAGGDTLRIARTDRSRDATPIPERGVVVSARGASDVARALEIGGSPGAPASLRLALSPFHPLEAVGGRPVLLRDSAIVSEVDTEGQAGFATGRHPRTAIGIAANGTRLIVVVVDGRQAPYSDGMTLREMANLFLALGARDAINLDGGGSTTMLYADPDSAGAFRTANRVSDAAGERPVGDALAILARRAESAKSCTPPKTR